MMTINTLVNFYFAQYEKLNIKGQYNTGLEGQYKVYTKEEFEKEWFGWLDKEVINTGFETCYTFKGEATYAKEIPSLFFLYK